MGAEGDSDWSSSPRNLGVSFSGYKVVYGASKGYKVVCGASKLHKQVCCWSSAKQHDACHFHDDHTLTTGVAKTVADVQEHLWQRSSQCCLYQCAGVFLQGCLEAPLCCLSEPTMSKGGHVCVSRAFSHQSIFPTSPRWNPRLTLFVSFHIELGCDTCAT